jgi:hypothetical protein
VADRAALPADVAQALERALAREGLFVVRPVDQAALDRAGVGFALDGILPGAGAALVVGDGGGAFFARFTASGAAGEAPDPLDRYTVRVIEKAVSGVLGARVPHAIRFPFDSGPPLLPIQRIGIAAGLPPPGPLGLQIHPVFGPWWGYRALVVLGGSVPPAAPLASPCAGCPAPCLPVCRGQAVALTGLRAGACVDHRLRDPACEEDCVARRGCFVGGVHAYSPAQLAFHMRASLVMIRAHRNPAA